MTLHRLHVTLLSTRNEQFPSNLILSLSTKQGLNWNLNHSPKAKKDSGKLPGTYPQLFASQRSRLPSASTMGRGSKVFREDRGIPYSVLLLSLP